MELVLEQTQQGTSYEVSVSAKGVEELKRKVKIKDEKKEAILTLRQKPDALVMRMASAAAKPCQGDSLEFYLSTGTDIAKILKNGQNRTNTDTGTEKRIQEPGECYQRSTKVNPWSTKVNH
ncbi:hypothetical protein Tco_1007123 [Tanacetum coccineum]